VTDDEHEFTERIRFRVTPGTAKRLGAVCQSTGLKPSLLMRLALEDLLARVESGAGVPSDWSSRGDWSPGTGRPRLRSSRDTSEKERP
jgi:hypothetical protein